MAKMNKAQLNVSVSEEAKLKTEEYGASGSYGSASNFVENALFYYIGALNREKEIKLETYARELEAKLEASTEELDVCKKDMARLQKVNELHTATILKLLTKYPELVGEVNELERQLGL